MNETNVQKHTPGPWECDTYLPEGYRVHPAGDKSYRTKTPDEFFANAALIASSPTLYAFVVEEARAGNKKAKIMLYSLGFLANSDPDILAERDRLRASNAELLAACIDANGAISYWCTRGGIDDRWEKVQQTLHAAIFNATKEQK